MCTLYLTQNLQSSQRRSIIIYFLNHIGRAEDVAPPPMHMCPCEILEDASAAALQACLLACAPRAHTLVSFSPSPSLALTLTFFPAIRPCSVSSPTFKS